MYTKFANFQKLIVYHGNCLFFFSDIDATSSGFDNGAILHIAASNLCLDAAKCLVSGISRINYVRQCIDHKKCLFQLQHGANAFIKDDKNRTPLNTIPEGKNSLELIELSSINKVSLV